MAIRPLDPDGPVPLTATVFRQLRVPDLIAEHGRLNWLADSALAHSPGFTITTDCGRDLSPDDATQYLRSVSSATALPPRVGRPTHWTPQRLAEAATVYRDAWLVRSNPTAAVAARFNLSDSGAAKVVRLSRKAGLLPPTTKGRAGWNAEDRG